MKLLLSLVLIAILCFATIAGQQQVRADVYYYSDGHYSHKSKECSKSDGNTCQVYDIGERVNQNDNSNNNHKSNNHKSSDNHQSNHKSSSDNHKSSSTNNQCCFDSTKGFNVNIGLDNAQPGKYQVRVIVYGVNTLNKPTLDKPGMTVSSDCVDCRINAGTWSFTDWKVQNGDSIKACALEIETYTTSCNYGIAHKDRTDTINVQLPGDVGD